MSSEFDITLPPYPAPFRRRLASNGILSYKVKCLSIGPILYILGALTTLATDTFHEYINDYAFFVACMILSVSFCGVVYACKQISPTINDLDKTDEHSKNSEFRGFINFATQEGYWYHIRDRYWNYLHTFGLSALSVIVAYLGIVGTPWVREVGLNARQVNHVYYMFWAAIMGYIVGLAFELTWGYSYVINRYCQDFIQVDNIRLLPLEEAGGLKPLGKLAFRINIASALPTIYGLTVIFKEWTEKGTTLLDKPFQLFILVVYVPVLTLIFLYPIYPAHKKILEAKQKAKENLSDMIKRTFTIRTLDNLESYDSLNSLLSTHSNLRRVSTWPLSLRLSIGSAVTILFPLIGGVILQIWFEFVFKLFA